MHLSRWCTVQSVVCTLCMGITNTHSSCSPPVRRVFSVFFVIRTDNICVLPHVCTNEIIEMSFGPLMLAAVDKCFRTFHLALLRYALWSRQVRLAMRCDEVSVPNTAVCIVCLARARSPCLFTRAQFHALSTY